jgi:hypothetical protein
MKYKNNFFYLLILLLVLSFCSSEPSQEEIQAQIDAAVEQALSKTSDEFSDKTDETTATTMPTVLAVPVGNYWGQYDDGTWAIVLSSKKPENFEWAWDVFNREDPSGYYGFDEFDENSTLIGTLVDFDCSFNRISKTEEHKKAFGEFETTIEYYDTYFDWAEDNYDYLTEEAILTISKIMRGVWTCDYEYLESISTEYLDFYYSGDAYPELPSLSEYIANYEDNYDDDNRFGGKYTYRLGALLYMTPSVEDLLAPPVACSGDYILIGQSPGYIWPSEGGPNPKELSDTQIAKMSMFDNGITKTLIENGSYGDGNTSYGYRLKISSDGVWYSYKFNGHTWPSGYATPIPKGECIVDLNPTIPATDVPYIGTTPYIKGIRIEEGDTFDSFIIELEITEGIDIVPNAPYIARCDRDTCAIDPEMGPFIPDYVDEWLHIGFSGYSVLRDINGEMLRDDEGKFISSFDGPGELVVTCPGFICVGITHARAYGEFEGNIELHLGIVPGSTYRSYQTANPQTIVIEVDK